MYIRWLKLFSLHCTGGKPLNVKIGTPDNKARRKSVQQISVSMIKEFQVVLELSGRKTEQLISGLILDSIKNFLSHVQFHNCGLARYAEQVGEAIHAKFKPTWGRYKRAEGHSEYGNRLFSAVINFGSR